MATRVRRLEVGAIEDLLLATGGDREFRPVQMGRRSVRGELAAAPIDDLMLTYGRFHSDIHVSGTWSNNKTTIGFLLAAEGASVFGASGQAGSVVVAGAGREIEARYRDTVEYVTVNVDKSYAMATAAGCGLAIDERVLDGTALLTPDTALLPSLTGRMQNLATAFRSGRLTADGPAAERRLADSVLVEFLQGLAQALPHHPDDNESHRSGSSLVRRIEAWLRGDPARTYRIPEIARHFDISPRHLNRAFQAEVGMSPARFLKRYRMTQARLDLHAADPTEKTVTEVAVSWGFWDLGRFAVEYRGVFGESPSHTLRTYAST